MSLEIYIYSLSLLVLLLASMILYLYKFMYGLLNKKHLYRNDAGLNRGTLFPLQSLKTFDGKDLTISKEVDGVVIINTSYICNVCKRIYPFLESIRKEYPNIQINLLMLADKEQAKENIEKYNLKSLSVSLIQDEDLHDLGITTFPFAYLLSAEGKVIEKGLVNYKKDIDLLISFLPYKKAS